MAPAEAPILFSAGLPQRHPRRWLLRLALAFIGLWVLWFGGVNLILEFHLIPQAINEHNPVVVLDYAKAWTYWPGTVHLRGFTLRGRDHEHVEFSFGVDEAYAVVDMPALLQRTFHATHVEVTGLDSRFRMKFDPTERVRAHLQEPLLPPIEGYADPPMSMLGPWPPDADDAHYADWSVDLEDVHITHLTQLWVQQYRGQLDGNIVGRFAMRPERAFNLTMTSLVFTEGEVTIGEDTAVDKLAGSIDGVAETFDPRAIHGDNFMRFISGHAEVIGTVPSVHFLHHQLPGFVIRGGGGPLTVGLTIDHGVVAEDTHLTLHGSPLTLESDRLALRGPFYLGVQVVAGAKEPRGILDLAIAPVTLALRSEAGAEVTGPLVHLHGTTSSLDLQDPLKEWQLSLDADRLVAPLAPWLRSLPKAIVIDSGKVILDTHLSFGAPSERGKGHVHAESTEVQGRIAGRKVGAYVDATVAIDRFSLPTRTLELAGSEVNFHAVRAPSLDRAVGGWWLKAELDRGSLDFSQSPLIDATAHAEARDARPILDFIAELGSIPHEVSELLELPNLKARAQAHLEEGTLTLAPVRVSSGATQVIAAATLRDDVNAALMIRSGPIGLGLEIVHDKLEVNLFHGDEALARAMEQAALRSAATPVRDSE